MTEEMGGGQSRHLNHVFRHLRDRVYFIFAWFLVGRDLYLVISARDLGNCLKDYSPATMRYLTVYGFRQPDLRNLRRESLAVKKVCGDFAG